MIDSKGLRANVGIILANTEGRLFWGRRVGSVDIWQFPQGGIIRQETPEQAMYRELQEEVGLLPEHVRLIAVSKHWLSYYLPAHLRRYARRPFCIGQKQKWFLLKLVASDLAIHFDQTPSPEFSSWCWVDYWYPLNHVIAFKKQVYKKVLEEFSSILHPL